MVLTEESNLTKYPPASMELSLATVEQNIYNNIPETRQGVPPGYPSNTPPGNQKVAKVIWSSSGTGTANGIGPGVFIKVMAGDMFNYSANSWWQGAVTSQNNTAITNVATSIISSISNAIVGQAGFKDFLPWQIQSGTNIGNSINNLLYNAPQNGPLSLPNAYVSWLLLDERLEYVQEGSGFDQVASSGVYKQHSGINIPIPKSGYLYVFVNNSNNAVPVYFDNLAISHTTGPLLEETHYYPFGLTMSGISSKAAGSLQNKNLFLGKELQNKEFTDGSGLELYDFTLEPL